MNYRQLFRKVESHLDDIENQPSLKQTLGLIIESILADFADDFGFTGARLYVLDQDESVYRLEAKFGDGTQAPLGFSIPRGYPPIVAVNRQGIVFMDLDSKGVDLAIEVQLGVEAFAAISVGAENGYVIAFSIAQDRRDNADDVLFALSSIRHSINLKLAKEKLESIILQSQEIQMSLLPEGDVAFPGYDIAGRSQPAEIVGGDVYDFLPVNPNIMGIAIGDATGHGLPAALQARDVITGLRMGISEDLKMVKLFEKLNKVIHRSRLTSRFVSLFYGELEVGGHFIYCNGGHNPPYYYRKKKDRFYALTDGGMVLGPSSSATYLRGFIRLEPGDFIIMYTDGISEAKSGTGEDYGECRILEYARARTQISPAKDVVQGLLEEAAAWSAPGTHVDDRTAVLIKRLG
jgi:sigma-B regulation protein RsbU (phosphoserine phosphatase)